MKLFLLDASVAFHQISDYLHKFHPTEDETQKFYFASMLWLNALSNYYHYADSEQCRVVWLQDSKPYWRSWYYPEYKGNRKPKPVGYSSVLKTFDSVKHHFYTLKVQHYEADDLAALACILFRMGKLPDVEEIFLLTSDTDWQGLIGEGITWVNLIHHQPRIRDVQVVYEWFQVKHRKQSGRKKKLFPLPAFEEFHPSQIWHWKYAVGDRSDNLSEGCEPWLIDLYNPHQDHCLWNKPEIVDQFLGMMGQNKPKLVTAKDATQMLLGLGFGVPLTYIV